MNIGILPFRREKRIDGINRLTYGILDELINIDKNNNYSYTGMYKTLKYFFEIKGNQRPSVVFRLIFLLFIDGLFSNLCPCA